MKFFKGVMTMALVAGATVGAAVVGENVANKYFGCNCHVVSNCLHAKKLYVEKMILRHCNCGCCCDKDVFKDAMDVDVPSMEKETEESGFPYDAPKE